MWDPAAPPDPRPPMGRMATVDHVVPRAAGGQDEMSNYALVCLRCNSRRWWAWRRAHPEWTPAPGTAAAARLTVRQAARDALR